jgi:hypothetical protein
MVFPLSRSWIKRLIWFGIGFAVSYGLHYYGLLGA